MSSLGGAALDLRLVPAPRSAAPLRAPWTLRSQGYAYYLLSGHRWPGNRQIPRQRLSRIGLLDPKSELGGSDARSRVIGSPPWVQGH
eukprot:2606969-Prymnesium_polylepis.1